MTSVGMATAGTVMVMTVVVVAVSAMMEMEGGQAISYAVLFSLLLSESKNNGLRYIYLLDMF